MNLFITLKPFFYLLVFLIIILFIRLLPEIIGLIVNSIRGYFDNKKYEKWLNSQKMLSDLIYKLRPEEFEDRVGVLLKNLGYSDVKVIGGIHQPDGGFDVKAKKEGHAYYVQVKKYGLKHPVSVKQIREFCGALKIDHPGTRGIFITTSFFTYGFHDTAREFANRADIELIDGRKLVELMK